MNPYPQSPLTTKRWLTFTTIGWFIGVLLVVGLAILIEVLFNLHDDNGGQAAVGIGMGAGVGWMQWRVIRGYLKSSRKYFWFSLGGFSFAFILMDIVAVVIDNTIVDVTIRAEYVLPFTVLFGAFISAWLQYKFLFKENFGKAINWIAYSMTGWLLATLITTGIFSFNLTFAKDLPKALVVIIALTSLTIGGPILGFLTGRFIVPRLNSLSGDDVRSEKMLG